jgi:hypothetical protein
VLSQHLTGVTEKTSEIVRIDHVAVEIGTKVSSNTIPELHGFANPLGIKSSVADTL